MQFAASLKLNVYQFNHNNDDSPQIISEFFFSFPDNFNYQEGYEGGYQDYYCYNQILFPVELIFLVIVELFFYPFKVLLEFYQPFNNFLWLLNLFGEFQIKLYKRDNLNYGIYLF